MRNNFQSMDICFQAVGKIILIITIIIVSQSSAMSDFGQLVKRLPTVYHEAVLEALKKAGSNQTELIQAIENCPEQQTTALGFLLANMPERDLVALKANFILENIAYAYKAMEDVPWSVSIPEDIFLNYVLPYVNIHERRDNWRKDFYLRFMPVVKDCQTPGEVCVKLNEVMWDMISVHYNTKRSKSDQSPYEAIEESMATCTGLSILLIDACRSVGVPARFVGIPEWTTVEGNHSWVEVWDGKWHFVGAGEPGPLNETWFVERAAKTDPTKRKHWIYAASFKKTNLSFPIIWDSTITYVYAENVTNRYLKSSDDDGKMNVSIRAFDKPGGARIALPVQVSQADVIVGTGQTRDETKDTNDLLTFRIQPNQTFLIKLDYQNNSICRLFTVTEDNSIVDIYLNEETRHADNLTPKNRKKLMLASIECKPHPRQLDWQRDEFISFVHFGVNTYTGREWGTGTEDPDIFRPDKLDTDQWCQAVKAAGMKMVIVTAKHHDGFCLWQTRYTTHSVSSCSWRDGKGDVVRELSESCKKYGLKLGIYLSPADLYQIEHPQGLYGNGSAYSERVIPRHIPDRPFEDKRSFRYNVDDYNEYFMNQLFELLTEYGPVYEVWLDGAHPKRKGGQQYTYHQWYDLVRTLAPQAVIFGKGPDVRWCGNEAGQTREAEWSVIPIGTAPEKWNWVDMTDRDIGSLNKINIVLEQGGVLHWHPAETDMSIRDGWFWRDEEQHVKSTSDILDVWYRTVGGNSVFLLNIPPNRDGLFSARDVSVLEEVGCRLKQTFSQNLAKGATATAPQVRGPAFKAQNILDGDPTTCWMPPDWNMQASVEITLPTLQQFNRLVLQEQIADFSQRIAEFAIDAWLNGAWQQIAEGKTVGYKRICRFETIATDKLRVRILDSRVCPTISNFELYFEQEKGN